MKIIGLTVRFLHSEYVRKILWFPALFLLSFVLVNSFIFKVNYQEMGDIASNAIQILKAKEFQTLTGAYSRFMVHHPGPITFYYLAFTEILFGFVHSVHGQHVLSIALYNTIFLMLSLHLFFRYLDQGNRIYWFMFALCISLSPLMPNAFAGVWGPEVILFPFLLFMVSSVCLSIGQISGFFWMSLASVFILQNQLGTVTVLGPVGLYSSVLYIRGSRETSLVRLLKSKTGIPFWLGLAVIILGWLPPLIEEMQNSPGNLTKILTLGAHNNTVNKPGPVFAYLFSYFTRPIPIELRLPDSFLAISLISFVCLFSRRLIGWEKNLFKILCLALFFSLLSAFKLQGGLLEHVFWYQFILVAFWFYLLIRLLPFSLDSVKDLPAFSVLSVSFILFTALNCRITNFTYNDSVDIFLQNMKLENKSKVYKLDWGFGNEDHIQAEIAAGMALDLLRTGFDVCINDSWVFYFRDDLKCDPKRENVLIHLETIPDKVETIRESVSGTWEYGNTRISLKESAP